MAVWPLDYPLPYHLPGAGDRGSYWEARGDRRHAGIDLYAPPGTRVLAAEAGVVQCVTIFTRTTVNPYWNQTYSIVVQTCMGRWLRYAELGNACVQPAEWVSAGQWIGVVGRVLALERIDLQAPEYIQRLGAAGVDAMLHFELHSQPPLEDTSYLGGNYFRDEPPPGLLDPTMYLSEALQERNKLQPA